MFKKYFRAVFFIASASFCVISRSLAGEALEIPVLHLVFAPLNYQNQQGFLLDQEMLIQKLKATRPFDEFASRINIRNIELPADFSSQNPSPEFLEQLFKTVGANYKLVVLDAAGPDCRAQLSELKATSVILVGRGRYGENDQFAKAFLHELGHSLGLRDESPEAFAEGSAPGYPNCARNKAEAEKWWGGLVGKDPRTGYIHGCCGHGDYIRPTIASLMNDIYKAGEFGPVNERYLRDQFRIVPENQRR